LTVRRAIAICAGAIAWSAAFAVPAQATANIACVAPDGAASIDLVIGRLPVLGVVNGSILAGDVLFSMEEGAENRIAVGQAHDDGSAVRVDFTDPNDERIGRSCV
jgi:hypothetical protein